MSLYNLIARHLQNGGSIEQLSDELAPKIISGELTMARMLEVFNEVLRDHPELEVE